MKKALSVLLAIMLLTSLAVVGTTAAGVPDASFASAPEYSVSKWISLYESAENVGNALNIGGGNSASGIESLLKNIIRAISSISRSFKDGTYTIPLDRLDDSLDFVNDGDTVKLTSNYTAGNVSVNKAVNLDLNGHTVICDSFTYTTGSNANLYIANGGIYAKGGGNVTMNAPKATLWLGELNVSLKNAAAQFIVDASTHTLNVYDDVVVVYEDSTPAKLTVAADTRVVVKPAVTKEITLVVAGNNVTVENATPALREEATNTSVVAIEVASPAVEQLVVTNAVVAEVAPVIPVTVPENYGSGIVINNILGSADTEVDVETPSGEEWNLFVIDGQMPKINHLSAEVSEDGTTATVAGLIDIMDYEYRACNETEYTAVPAGSVSFDVTAKHIFVRIKAKNTYAAGEDFSLYTGIADPAKTLSIYCIDELKAFRDTVNAGTNVYKGNTVNLMSDIDLNNEEWLPIGCSGVNTMCFQGTFDGKGHTVSNLVVTGTYSNTDANNDMGLFGKTNGGTLKNLTVNNADVSGSLYVGAIVGRPWTTKLENLNVTGDVSIRAWWYAGAIGGYGYFNMADCHVNANEGSSVAITGGYAGGLVGFCGEGVLTRTNCSSNIDVSGTCNGVGGLFGIIHYQNKLENCSSSGNVTIYPESDEENDCVGGIGGGFCNTGSGTGPSLTNCTFTGTLYQGSEISPRMNTYPLFGKSRSSTSFITVDGVVIDVQ